MSDLLRAPVLVVRVAGGIAEYFAIDPTLARVVLFLALLPAGPLAPIIPEPPLAEQGCE